MRDSSSHVFCRTAVAVRVCRKRELILQGVCLEAASPAQCVFGKDREGRGASQGLGSESSSRPLPAPASISECVGSHGLSGLCLPYCGIPFGLTRDKGCVTSEAF